METKTIKIFEEIGESPEVSKGTKVKIISLSRLDEFSNPAPEEETVIGKEATYLGDLLFEIEGNKYQFVEGIEVEILNQ